MSFTARPGAGSEVALRGAVAARSRRRLLPALFTVWFGPEPGDENLKRGMLGS